MDNSLFKYHMITNDPQFSMETQTHTNEFLGINFSGTPDNFVAMWKCEWKVWLQFLVMEDRGFGWMIGSTLMVEVAMGCG